MGKMGYGVILKFFLRHIIVFSGLSLSAGFVLAAQASPKLSAEASPRIPAQTSPASMLLTCRSSNPNIGEVSVVRGTKDFQILIRRSFQNKKNKKRTETAQSFRLLNFSGLYSGQAESIVFARNVSSEKDTLLNAGILSVDAAHEEAFLAMDRSVFKLRCQSKASKREAIKETNSLVGLESQSADSNIDVSSCISKMKFEKAKTLQDCQKLRLEMPGDEKCSGPQGMAIVEKQISSCYDQVLAHEFENRIVVVKFNNNGRHRTEVQQQSSFKKMRDEICNRYLACKGGWVPSAVSNCRLQLTGYRYNQIRRINEMSLAVKNKKYEGEKWSGHATRFADLLCGMPPQVWNKDEAPKDCQQRIFGEIASFNGVPLPGVNPCEDSD